MITLFLHSVADDSDWNTRYQARPILSATANAGSKAPDTEDDRVAGNEPENLGTLSSTYSVPP